MNKRTSEVLPTPAVNNGLALEYQGNYGTARGDLDVAYLVNNPVANGVCSVLSGRFDEEGFRFLGTDAGALANH